MVFTVEEENYLILLAQKGLKELAYEQKVQELDNLRQSLYAQGILKADVDLQCKSLEDEATSLNP